MQWYGGRGGEQQRVNLVGKVVPRNRNKFVIRESKEEELNILRKEGDPYRFQKNRIVRVGEALTVRKVGRLDKSDDGDKKEEGVKGGSGAVRKRGNRKKAIGKEGEGIRMIMKKWKREKWNIGIEEIYREF